MKIEAIKENFLPGFNNKIVFYRDDVVEDFVGPVDGYAYALPDIDDDMHQIEAIIDSRSMSFVTGRKDKDGAPQYVTSMKATIGFIKAAKNLTLEYMEDHQWVMVVSDLNCEDRIVGKRKYGVSIRVSSTNDSKKNLYNLTFELAVMDPVLFYEKILPG